MLSLFSAGIAPGLALISYFYLRDQYEPEPILQVFKVFMLGALLTFPIMFVQYIIEVEGLLSNVFLQSFISAALLEEFFKWFILFLAVYKHATFDELYDGIVYGASISLGFATVENILYLLSFGIEYAIGRALLPVSSHALFGVLMGYYLGKAKFNIKDKQKTWLATSLILPFLLHGIYDSIFFIATKWNYFMVPFMLLLWYFSLKKTKQAHLLSHAINDTKSAL